LQPYAALCIGYLFGDIAAILTFWITDGCIIYNDLKNKIRG